MKAYPVLLVSALTFWLASCSSSKKLTAPPLVPAVTVSVPDSLPALPLSQIDVPLKIAGKPLLAIADSLLPKEFVSIGWPAFLQPSCDFRYKYRFVRSDLTIRAADNKLSVRMEGNYQVSGGRCLCALNKPVSPWVSGNCGFDKEPMRKIDIYLSTQLTFLPDYRIRTVSRPDQLKPLDKCVMSLFSMDMTQQIVDSIRSSINGFCGVLDHAVAGLNFTSNVRQAAVRAWQRTPMGPYGYLTINPSDLRIGTLDYTRDTFHISLGMTCRPELGSDSSNKTAAIPPLPPLHNGVNRDGVTLYLSARYDYSFLNKVLNDSLRDRSFLFKGRTVVIKEVELKGIGRHQLEMMIGFGGDRKGRLYLRGTPVLDTAKQALIIPDISYSLESKDLALKMAKTLLRNKIRKSLKGNSYLDLAALLKTHLPALDAQFNRQLAPNLRSTGSVRRLRLIGLLAGGRSIEAQFYLSADLTVIGTGLPR